MDIVEKRCDFRSGPRGAACGKPVPENLPTEFALAPNSYYADLCTQHQKGLADALAPFVAIARSGRAIAAVNGRGRKILRGRGGKTFTTRDVREWLVEQGKIVPPTGRIPNADIEAFMKVRATK